MPKRFVITLVALLIGTWFLVGEKRSFNEKLTLLFFVVFIYVIFRLLAGATFDELLAPFRDFSGNF